MCEARGVPVLRIGVTDATSGAIEIQDVATLSLDELRAANRAPIRGRFA
jgi:phosphoribosylformylglycinamidine synthase